MRLFRPPATLDTPSTGPPTSLLAISIAGLAPGPSSVKKYDLLDGSPVTTYLVRQVAGLFSLLRKQDAADEAWKLRVRENLLEIVNENVARKIADPVQFFGARRCKMDVAGLKRKSLLGEEALAFHPVHRSPAKAHAIGIEMSMLGLVADNQDGVAMGP